MTRICKVLIVEDHDQVRELLGEVLTHEGFDFTAVDRGGKMRQALDDDDFDIVIIDVSQPEGENGFELAKAARQLGCGVILITGDHNQTERLRKSGHHYMLKPFGLRELLALVEQVLRDTEALCARRTRSDGSDFPARPG